MTGGKQGYFFKNFISPLNKKCGTHCDIAPTFHQINLIN